MSPFLSFINPSGPLVQRINPITHISKCPKPSHSSYPSNFKPQQRSTTPYCGASTPPRRIGAVAKDLKNALQTSLTARTSRILVQLPPAARLGTEPRDSSTDTINNADIIAGNRELARLLIGMFESTGLSIRLVFSNTTEKSLAQKIWPSTINVTMDISRPSSRKSRRSSSAGFSSGNKSTSTTKNDHDVHILVGGGVQMLNYATDLCKQYGQETLVILANVNTIQEHVSSDVQDFIDQTFISVYYHKPNPHPTWQGGVLFRKFPDDWVLCRMTRLGILQTLFTSSQRPSMSDIGDILKGRKEKTSQPSNAFLNAITSLIDKSDT